MAIPPASADPGLFISQQPEKRLQNCTSEAEVKMLLALKLKPAFTNKTAPSKEMDYKKYTEAEKKLDAHTLLYV